jgi:hypothetical protein
LYYEFLAFSLSQLKARSCWFLRPTATTTAQHIISKLGLYLARTHTRTTARTTTLHRTQGHHKQLGGG